MSSGNLFSTGNISDEPNTIKKPCEKKSLCEKGEDETMNDRQAADKKLYP